MGGTGVEVGVGAIGARVGGTVVDVARAADVVAEVSETASGDVVEITSELPSDVQAARTPTAKIPISVRDASRFEIPICTVQNLEQRLMRTAFYPKNGNRNDLHHG